MAQTGFTPLQLYYSLTAAATPVAGNLTSGELAINITDGKLYYKDNAGVVQVLATKATTAGTFTTLSVSGAAVLTGTGNQFSASGTGSTFVVSPATAGTLNNVAIGGTTAAAGSFTALTSTGTTSLGATSATSINNTPIGATTAHTGAFTTLSASGAATLQGTGNKISVSGTGSTFVVNPAAAGSLDNVAIGGTTPLAASVTNLSYSGSLTGGTGVINIGSGQVYKDAAGNVGIGTSSPQYPVDVRTAASNGVRVGSNQNAFGSLLYWDNTTGEARLWSLGSFPLVLGTNSAERLRLDTAGNLGLGVTPSAWNTLTAFETNAGAIAGNSQINLASNAYFNSGWKYKNSSTSALYFQGSGAHQFFTAPSGTAGAPITFTQAMTLTSGGNLLVGLTTPAFGGLVEFSAQNNAGSVSQAIYNTGTGGARLNLLNNLNSGAIEYLNTDGLKFFVTDRNTERARITSGGYFKASNTGVYGGVAGVGDLSATNQYVFQSNQNNVNIVAISNNTGTSTISYGSYLPSGATGVHFYGAVNGNATYQINANGSGGQVSDANLKTDITEATPKLADLNRVRIVNYRWKEESGISDRKEIGVIAQELEQVFPGLVDTIEREDGTEQKMVRYSVFVPMLIKAVQELSAQNAALESRLAALESK